jgi:asparagine synthase (glutamine-hydrolysing)
VREGLRRLGEYRAEPADWPVACRVHPDFRAQAQPGAALYGERMREVGAEGCVDAFFARAHPWPPADVFLTEFIARSYLLANGIAQADRLAMAHSVEPRLPLLDHRLVETVVGLRKCRSDREARPKDWFLRAVADLVPGGLGAGPKRGFEPPVRAWHEAIFARYGSMLDGGALVREGILLADAARRLGTGVTGRNVITPLSFKALVLEIWLRALGEATERSRSPEAAACRT